MKFKLAFLAMMCLQPAFAQEAPPACDFVYGKNVTFAQVGNTVGAHWWCPSADGYGGWQWARAAKVVESGSELQTLVKTPYDFGKLLAGRTLPTTAPEFASLWASMAPAIAQSKPVGPWAVAPAPGATVRQVYRRTNDTTGVSDMIGLKIAIGSPCNCDKRIGDGNMPMCQVGIVPEIVAICSKSQ